VIGRPRSLQRLRAFPPACALAFSILVITVSPAHRRISGRTKNMKRWPKRFPRLSPELTSRRPYFCWVNTSDVHYSLTSLFADDGEKSLTFIMGPTLREAEAAYSSIYEHHAPLIRFLTGSGTPAPKHCRSPQTCA